MDDMQVAEAAEFLLHLRRQRTSVAALPFEIAPRSLDDAYAIQDEMHFQAGWPLEVYKVGCTSRAAQEALGIPHPAGGRLPSEGCFAAGAIISRSFFSGAPLAECEIAMRVDARGRVDAVAPAIELVNGRFIDNQKVSGASIVADNAAGAGVVLGEARAVEDFPDLSALDIELRTARGDVVAAGNVGALLDGPEASVAWTIDHETGRARVIEAGSWIITGTCTGLTPTEFDTSYTADFGPLGAISFTLA